MNLSDYKKDAFRTAGPYATNKALAALGLLTEMAEFLRNPTVDEAGDVLWHIVVLDAIPLCDIEAAWRVDSHDAFGNADDFLDWVEKADGVKKWLAKGAQVFSDEASVVIGMAIKEISRYPLEEVIAFNVDKRQKRYPYDPA